MQLYTAEHFKWNKKFFIILFYDMKQNGDDLDITRQHLGRVIRANNRTRKRTRHQHYPKV